MGDGKADNVTWHRTRLLRADREHLLGHRGAILWFTGLSGSGKSTIANTVDHKLHEAKVHTYLLDGDNLRHGINGDLGFSAEDRVENIRRIGEIAKLFVDAGIVVIVAAISPYRRDRDLARSLAPQGRFVEIFVDTPLEICEQRDPKGLYRRARAGEIQDFTGIDAPYERPEAAELTLAAQQRTPDDLADEVVAVLRNRGLIS